MQNINLTEFENEAINLIQVVSGMLKLGHKEIAEAYVADCLRSKYLQGQINGIQKAKDIVVKQYSKPL